MRYKTLVHFLGKGPKSAEARKARSGMKQAGVAPKLLAELRKEGTIPRHPYNKWRGAHWILAAL